MHLYNLTLQRATGITNAIHGNFSGTKQQEIVISRGKILEILRHDPNTGKVYTLLTEEVFAVVRCLLPARLTGGNKGLLYNKYVFFLLINYWLIMYQFRSQNFIINNVFLFFRLHNCWFRFRSCCYFGVQPDKEFTGKGKHLVLIQGYFVRLTLFWMLVKYNYSDGSS